MSHYIVSALYKFAPLQDLEALQQAIRSIAMENGVLGSLLLADEGINGTIATPTRAGMDNMLNYLRKIPGLSDLEHKESGADHAPFLRLKIRLKKEIVTIGVPEASPTKTVGTYVAPADWNALISDPDVLVLDTRNDYEVAIGTFKNAVDPDLKTFRAFPEFVRKNLHNQKHKKVAMFCTGGIRCEKASSLMKLMGFDEVYHLKGGILKYLEEIPAEQSLWNGECFVFDQRVSVGNGLKAGSYAVCTGCRWPLDADDLKSQKYIPDIACPHCHDSLTPEKKQGLTERLKQIKLAKERGDKHVEWQELSNF